jgi:anti-sigma factor RsiW
MKMDHFHPADDRLIALYFGEEEVGADDWRAVRQHLHGCETCTWRYTELTAPLERLRQDAAGEADEVFTQARLDAQRTKILDRLDEAAHGSRVIPFPAATSRLDRSVVRRPIVRWVAAAAAAGLLIGVMAGRLLETGAGRAVPATPVVRTAKTGLAAPGLASDSPTATLTAELDEAVLSEIDQAVYSQRIAALSALDQMTPHVRQEVILARAVR